MNKHVANFDNWIRGSFVEMNTELEQLYYAQQDRSAVESVGEEIKQELAQQGRSFIADLLQQGNTDEGFDQAFDFCIVQQLAVFAQCVSRLDNILIKRYFHPALNDHVRRLRPHRQRGQPA